MSYNTRILKTDMSGKTPVPQYFNPEVNNYEVLYGSNGASRSIIYDKDGKPLFTSVNPGMVYDPQLQSELQQIKARLYDPILTKLTGSYTTQSSIFTRALRTSSQNTNIMRPAGAKGCIIYLTVYGITGSFASGQGVRLRAQLQGVKGFSFGDIYTEIQTTPNRSQIIMMYPGATDANVPAAVGGSRVIAPIYAPPRISLSIVISGTFGGGEGIDCEVDIEWLYG